MKNRINGKGFFYFDSGQRKGLLLFFIIVLALQSISYFYDFSLKGNEDLQLKEEWLAFQKEIDSLKTTRSENTYQIYPFNPNFITDFKGYKLGMSVAEIDRLIAFRKQNKFVNSAKEFQQVTLVSDSLLALLEVHFKFPDWVTQGSSKNRNLPFSSFATAEKKIEVKNINEATQEDLIRVYGIGSVLSERILQQKELLGNFVSMEQLKEVWGITSETFLNLNKYFQVTQFSELKKVNVNTASIKDLMKFPYFKYPLAKEIVTYRSMNGEFKGSEDLAKIKDFPFEKLEFIALYLEF